MVLCDYATAPFLATKKDIFMWDKKMVSFETAIPMVDCAKMNKMFPSNHKYVSIYNGAMKYSPQMTLIYRIVGEKRIEPVEWNPLKEGSMLFLAKLSYRSIVTVTTEDIFMIKVYSLEDFSLIHSQAINLNPLLKMDAWGNFLIIGEKQNMLTYFYGSHYQFNVTVTMFNGSILNSVEDVGYFRGNASKSKFIIHYNEGSISKNMKRSI